MCVDDLVCQGAEPLFFLDYIAVGKLDPDHIEQLVEGVAHGCRQAGCALIGGEMAEHPGAMEPGEFDLVGFAVGVAERDRLITGEHVAPRRRARSACPRRGCAPTGTRWPARCCSSGASRAARRPGLGRRPHSLADELLLPSVIYAPAIAALLRVVDVRSIAHITGGGTARQPRAGAPRWSLTPSSTRASWEPPRIFGEIQRLGEVSDDEMRKVFNLGIGMVVVVAAAETHKTLDILRTEGHRAVEIGRLESGHGHVRFE